MATKDKLSFEGALHELTAITERLEQEDVDLEDGLKQFERGLVLVTFLKRQLEDVENRVKEIKVRFRDVLTDTDEVINS